MLGGHASVDVTKNAAAQGRQEPFDERHFFEAANIDVKSQPAVKVEADHAVLGTEWSEHCSEPVKLVGHGRRIRGPKNLLDDLAALIRVHKDSPVAENVTSTQGSGKSGHRLKC